MAELKDAIAPEPFTVPSGGGRVPVWIRVVPYFGSALLFLSGFFAVLSPLPVLVTRLLTGRNGAWAAAAINIAVVIVLAGPVPGVFFAIYGMAPALVLPEFLKRTKSLEKSALLTLLVMAATGAVLAWLSNHWGPLAGHGLVPTLKDALRRFLELSLAKMEPGARDSLVGGRELKDFESQVLSILPSTLATLGLVVVWLSLVAAIRLDPRRWMSSLGFTRSILTAWKAPEWLVWPAIASGASLVVPIGGGDVIRWLPLVGENVFRFLMAVYAIQGLSILGFFLNRWKVRGIARSLIFVLGLFLLLPLVLGLGFFDLWFDFRGKIRQT